MAKGIFVFPAKRPEPKNAISESRRSKLRLAAQTIANTVNGQK
jgi:hypothetical protein